MPATELLLSPARHDLRPAAAGAEVERLSAAAAAYAEASLAPTTRRAYDSSWRTWLAWCARRGAPSLPTLPLAIAGFLVELAADGAKVATLTKHLAAIAQAHRVSGHPMPEHPDLGLIWAGIRRKNGIAPVQKRALVTADLKRVVSRLPSTTAGIRDKALLLVGFAGAFRRSELVALHLGAGQFGSTIEFVAGGLEARLGRSKTDQEGRGQVIAIPRGKTRLCPVAALRAWLEISQICNGPIWRAVDRHGRISAEALTDRAVALIVKRAVERAGFDPDLFAGHSLRAGLVTSAAEAGVPTELIMRQTRHQKYETVAAYVRSADLFKRNAAGRVGL